MEPSEYIKMAEMEDTHWWFVAKRNILKLFIKKNIGEIKGLKVIDIGCGTGAILQMISDLGADAVGVDMSHEALKFCREKNLNVVLGKGESIPFESGRFDLVLASDVLEHVDDDAGAMREIERILKPGGVFIATVPAHQWLFSAHDHLLHHRRRYSKNEFRKLLENNFEDVKISWIHSAILIPAIVQRTLTKFIKFKDSGTSGNAYLNKVMGLWYRIELAIIEKYNKSLFGLSLIGVARKTK